MHWDLCPKRESLLSQRQYFTLLILPTPGRHHTGLGSFLTHIAPAPARLSPVLLWPSTPAVRRYRRNEHPPGCWREQIYSWAILRGVGGIEGLGEYGYVTSIFTHADLTEAQGVCYHVICDMLFVYHFFFY